MNLDMFNAHVTGYKEHLFDLECIAVMQGYWAGYYQSKKPKAPKIVLSKMVQEREKERRKAKTKNMPRPDVDVAAFLEQEAKFKSRYNKSNGKKRRK